MKKETVRQREIEIKARRTRVAELIRSLPDDAIVHVRFAEGGGVDAEELPFDVLQFWAAQHLKRISGGRIGGSALGTNNNPRGLGGKSGKKA